MGDKRYPIMRTLPDRWTPPSWMRHISPWWVLLWLDRHLNTCWAGIAMWKLGYEWSWWPNGCWDGRPGQEYDYCGKWKTEDAIREAMGQSEVKDATTHALS